LRFQIQSCRDRCRFVFIERERSWLQKLKRAFAAQPVVPQRNSAVAKALGR